MGKPLPATRREYTSGSLDESSMNADPMKHFTRWYDDANDAGIEEPNAMVLSTAGTDGHVSARVVLLKGVEPEGFVFFTNYDSRKGQQLSCNPYAALTFLWLPSERQVRVEGTVSKIPRRESVAYFENRPFDSRISAVISPQSSVIPDRSFLDNKRQKYIKRIGESMPECPPYWGGYLLKPSLVEFWQGRAHRMHDRIQYRLEGTKWLVERLAP
jgi:pyridoxamine 5'-phosphate oxidase